MMRVVLQKHSLVRVACSASVNFSALKQFCDTYAKRMCTAYWLHCTLCPAAIFTEILCFVVALQHDFTNSY